MKHHYLVFWQPYDRLQWLRSLASCELEAIELNDMNDNFITTFANLSPLNLTLLIKYYDYYDDFIVVD